MQTGQDKIKKICEAIKSQTIEPAKQKAHEIIENAKLQAIEIKQAAESERSSVIMKMEEELARKKKLYLTAIQSASRQVIDQLKQDIEKHFFKTTLFEMISNEIIDPKVIAKMITVIIEAIEKDGIESDLSAVISKNIKSKDVDLLLAKEILEKLKEKKVIEGNFAGGAKIRLCDKQVTIDISDEALSQLLEGYIRKDFRDLIFEV